MTKSSKSGYLKKMLYLFNSGYRPGYTTNVLNTLFLPSGLTNKYRYRIDINVDTSIANEIKTGDETLITFIDRFAESGYAYYPLRLGKFFQSYSEAGQLFFVIILGECIYPKKINEFQDLIKTNLSSAGLPKVVNEDRNSDNDGKYALISPNLINAQSSFLREDEAWSACINDISKTTAFKPTASNEYVFLKASIHSGRGHGKGEELKIKESTEGFSLFTEESYILKLIYRYPMQNVDRNRVCSLSILKDDDIIVGKGSTKLGVDKFGDEVRFLFSVRRNPQNLSGEFKVEVVSTGQGETKAYFPDAALSFRVFRNWKERFFTIIAFVVMVLSSTMIGSDFSKDKWFSAWALVFAVLQAGAIYYLYWKLGRKGE